MDSSGAAGEAPPRPFILDVKPLIPQPEEGVAWSNFLGTINAAGWSEVPGNLALARAGDGDWQSVLRALEERLHDEIARAQLPLAEAIGNARSEELVAGVATRVLLAKAECLEGLARWEEAVATYMQIESEDPELYLRRGCMYYYAGNTGTADSNFDLAVHHDPRLQSQIDAAKAAPPPLAGAVPLNPGMIGPMRVGETRPGVPAYDAAFEAATLGSEDAQMEQAIQASLKEDHFSAGGPADAKPMPSDMFDLPAVVEELEGELVGCLSEASQLPQCACQPWSAHVEDETEALTLLGWTEKSWETVGCKAPWTELTEPERGAAEAIGFTVGSWVWMKFREWLPRLIDHFIGRKGQPTWDESMAKRNADGVAAAKEYETVHQKLIALSIRILSEAVRRRYRWAGAPLRQLLEMKRDSLYTFQKWSTSTSKMEEMGALHLHRGALVAFAECSGAANIAEALEGATDLKEETAPLLELLVLVHANASKEDDAVTIAELGKETERSVAACASRLALTNQVTADEHNDTLAVLQNLLKLKAGKPAAVEQWKDLCMRGLTSEKYLVRLSALEQLAQLADSADAGLSAEEFTEWVMQSNVYDQVFGEKMPLDKPEYKQRAKVFFRHAKLTHDETNFALWTNLLLPKLSASVVQELIAEVCLDQTIPLRLWLQLVKRLTAIVKGESTGYDGDEQCQQSVLAFTSMLFADVEKVTGRHDAVCDIAELLKAALEAWASASAVGSDEAGEEADRARLLLLNAFSDIWNYMDDSDEFQQVAEPEPEVKDSVPEPEGEMSGEDAKAALAKMEQKKAAGVYVSGRALKALQDRVAKEASGKPVFAGEMFDAESASKDGSKEVTDLSNSQESDGGSQTSGQDGARAVVPGLNLSSVEGHTQGPGGDESLSLAEEQVLEECLHILEGNQGAAGRGQMVRLIQEIRQTGGVVTTDVVVTRMFDTPMEPEESSSSSADDKRAERLRQEREAAAPSEPGGTFNGDLSGEAFPSLGGDPAPGNAGKDAAGAWGPGTDQEVVEELEDDHEKWGVFVCSGENDDNCLEDARAANALAKTTEVRTDYTQVCTQCSRALTSIMKRLGPLEEKIGTESASNVVHAVKVELYDMRAHAWFSIGSWQRCIGDCEDYLDLVGNTEIEELSKAAARRKFDEGEEGDGPSGEEAAEERQRKRVAFATEDDPVVILQLSQMGFSENSCKRAIRNSNGDAESAMEWILKHSQDDDIDDDPGDPSGADKENETRGDGDGALVRTTAVSVDKDAGLIRSDGTEIQCVVTYADTSDWVGMASCGHKFSTDAWTDWIRTHKDKPEKLLCMGQCKVPIPTNFVLECVLPGDRESVKKKLEGKGTTSSGTGGSAADATAPARLFHESLRDLRVKYAKQSVADIHRQMQTDAGCMSECRPVAVDFLLATLQSFSLGWNRNSFPITQVDAERRGKFIEAVNAPYEWGATLVEMLLEEAVTYAKQAIGPAQRDGVTLRLELLTLLHRFCEPLLLSWSMIDKLWNGLECRSLLFPWMRASLTHSPEVEPVYERAFACCEPDVRKEVLSHLSELSASQLDVQAYHLFQNIMIDLNAEAEKLKVGGWVAKPATISGGDYCASSAMPAGSAGLELVEFKVGNNSLTGVVAGDSDTKELHGSRAVPKVQDGAKLLGTWVKVLQKGQVWKDGQLTRYHTKTGSAAMYDIRYVDGSVQRRSLASLNAWMMIDPLEEQVPMMVNVVAVTDGDLMGLDVLWRAAVQAPDEEVSRLARSLLFRLYTQMGDTLCSDETIQLALDTADPMLLETISDSIGIADSLARKALVLNQNDWDRTFQWIEEHQTSLEEEAATPLTLEQAQLVCPDALPADLRVRLVDQVESGLNDSIALLEGGNSESAEQTIRRQIDIVQSFVNRYHINSKSRKHAVSRRGEAVIIKVHNVTMGSLEAHDNMTCGELHAKVRGYLSLGEKAVLDVVKDNKTTFLLPSGGMKTLAVAGIQTGFEVKQHVDQIGERPTVEAPAMGDSFCPGDLLADSDRWFGLLFDLLDRPISRSTKSAIWHLLMSIPTVAHEKQEVSQFNISWSKTSFLRTVYDLQVVEGILSPASEDTITAEDWRRSFISTDNHFKMFLEFVSDMESYGGDLDDPTVCNQCLPVTMRVLYFCISSALSDGAPGGSEGLSRSFSSSTATALFSALEEKLGENYFVSLVQHVSRLMGKAVAAEQAQPTIFGAQVLLTVASQPQATAAVLEVGVPLLVSLLTTFSEDSVRAEAGKVLHSLAVISEDVGLRIMSDVRSSPPTAECAAICEEYFALLQQLQRRLPSARQELAASLVADLQDTSSADVETEKPRIWKAEKPVACRVDLLRDILEQDASVQSTVVSASLIELLWTRYLMAVAGDDGDHTPVCRSAVGRRAVCDLLKQCVSTDADGAESPHFAKLAELASVFVATTSAPMQRDGESPEVSYDPAKRTDYEDSTTTKLRNSTQLAGLTNQGNTCYMNSVLQQLYGATEVRRAVLDAPFGLRIRVENFADSLREGAEVTLSGAAMEPLCISADDGLSFNGMTELTKTLPEGLYTVRVSCEGRVCSQEHDFGTGVHVVGLSDNIEGNVEQAVRHQPVVSEVHRCFSFLEYDAAACVNTDALCTSLHARKTQHGASYMEYPIRSQNCAAEFLGKIIDTLGVDMQGSRAATSLKDVVTSTKVVEKQCLECNTVSQTAEDHAVLLSVTVETPELEQLGSLEKALALQTKPEIMSGESAVDCENCGKRCPTSLTALAKKLPKVLLVHLTRFVQNMYGEYHKANHRVTFPHRLDMRPYTTTSAGREVSEPPAWYELTGVVLHSGTVRAGHYTSLVKHNGQWITFDDQHASIFDGDLEDICFGGEEEVTQSWGMNRTSKREKSKNAYILMYQIEGAASDVPDGSSSSDSAEGETPDSATWAVRRSLRETLQEHKQTLQRQQCLFDPDVLGLIRSLCGLGLTVPEELYLEDSGLEPEPEPDKYPAGWLSAYAGLSLAEVQAQAQAQPDPVEPTALDSELLELAMTTFVSTVCRYRGHPDISLWANLLVHLVSKPERLRFAEWLILRVGGEDGWAEADALYRPAVPKSYAARAAFVKVLQAAVDLVRASRGEQEETVEATAVTVAAEDHNPGILRNGTSTPNADDIDDEVAAATASVVSVTAPEPAPESEPEPDVAVATAVVEAASGAPDEALTEEEQAMNQALSNIRKQLAKIATSVTASSAAGTASGRRNAMTGTMEPPVPPLMLMDRGADLPEVVALDVKIENQDGKPMKLSAQKSPDRDWQYLQDIAPGSQQKFEQNEMMSFKGVVPGVGEYTWTRNPAKEAQRSSPDEMVIFHKTNYTGASVHPALCLHLLATVLCVLSLSVWVLSCAGTGLSADVGDQSNYGGEAKAHPPSPMVSHRPSGPTSPADIASKDSDTGPDVVIGRHKVEPTPADEEIISQAIDMGIASRQQVVRAATSSLQLLPVFAAKRLSSDCI